ncbi:hypothetical protein BO78DRAFT_309071, partial [Aspergillus sclerotiicarbonarius CBS 121057]
TGSVRIINTLDIELYLWSISIQAGPLNILAANGGAYEELWRPTINGTGVSIKIATADSMLDVLQFEYSIVYPTVYWDVSCINLDNSSVMITKGLSAIPDIPGCPFVICDETSDACPDVYYKPYDNYAVRGCSANASVDMQIGY